MRSLNRADGTIEVGRPDGKSGSAHCCYQVLGMNIDELNLGDDDVVVVHADQCKGMHLYVNLRKQIGGLLERMALAQWFNQGVQIEYLKTSGGGWKKGTLRLYLEFTPEKSELEDDPNSLDSIRAKLNDQ